MKGRPSVEKRRKERARQDRKREKAERRDRRKAERAQRSDSDADEDPDIAGIVPGPQPIEEDPDIAGIVPGPQPLPDQDSPEAGASNKQKADSPTGSVSDSGT